MDPGPRIPALGPRAQPGLCSCRVLGPPTRWLDLARDLWERARREHSSPREIGLAVGVGAFVACTPLIGFHLWLALGFATLLKLNRLWAMIGSRLSTTPILLVTTFA